MYIFYRHTILTHEQGYSNYRLQKYSPTLCDTTGNFKIKTRVKRARRETDLDNELRVETMIVRIE